MATTHMTLLPLHSLFLLFILLLSASSSCAQRQIYIVYFGEHSGDKALHEIEATHHAYLQSVKETEEEATASLLYSYKNSINGFAAELTPEEASKLSALEEVVSVIPNHPRKHEMHTTRSWEFVGLDEMVQPQWHAKRGEDMLTKAEYGSEIIVGVLDSGFWPESKSFSDEGMGPVPKSWKGICQTGDYFKSSHCNRKVIGARYYLSAYEKYFGSLNATLDYRSPRDKDGHGTHTASTVGGREVYNASFLRTFAHGTASGGAPLARLAIYKACWAIPGHEKVEGNVCLEADMLAAIDDAIGDGVHLLSASIGSTDPLSYANDGIAIGALHAVKHGIVVVCSAGNSGPKPGGLSNPAPWIITVGASSLDRNFPAPVLLGNGMKVEGETVTTYKLDSKKLYPLVYAVQVELPSVPKSLSGQCMPNSLSPAKAQGKIVLCLRGNGTRIGKGQEVKRAGAAGYILGNSPAMGNDISVDAHVLPATAMGSDEAIQILNYINSTKNPMATIIAATTVINTKPAPSMASFTSRGPNVIDPNILKPDITAPGLNILAAWSGADSPTKLSGDHRIVQWNIYSGTSMSCPHVSAAAALVKAIHPTWSSAAIRSALMTTAGLTSNVGAAITDETGKAADSFQFGAGHLRPTKAIDPGLVYDASYTDYLVYLCSGGVTNVDPSFKCPKHLPKSNDLNYPSIAIFKLNGTDTVRRRVTNVGEGKSVYSASVKPPMGYKVKVYPSILNFKHVGQKKSFKVTFEKDPDVMVSKEDQQEYSFGWLTWFDGCHNVRSPMVVSST